MRHRRRALSYMFRQFALASLSVQRLVVITVRDLASMVVTGSMAATLIGADVAITGTNQVCVEAAVSAATHVKAMLPVLRTHVFRFHFDFRKSRLLQLLIQLGKIGLQ